MNRRGFLTLTAGTVGATAGCSEAGIAPQSTPTASSDGGVLHVAPDGSSGAPGTEDAPLGSIRSALEQAWAGNTIYLHPGTYREQLHTVRSGDPEAPITITGPSEAVWSGTEDTSVIFTVAHDHIHVTGITFDGLVDEDRAYETREAYVNTLVTISPVSTHNTGDSESLDYLHGVVFEPSAIGNCASNMIFVTRLRDASIGGFEIIGPAGMAYHPDVEDGIESHVGEIIYLGTGIDDMHRESYPYPWDGLDRSRNIRIHHIDNSAGYHHSEMADLKVGCEDITVEYCTDRAAGGQTDGVPAGAISPKGNDCTVRWNDIGECPIPIEFDPYAPGEDVDATDWSQNNAVYGNYLHGYSREAILFRETRSGPIERDDQRVFCGNVIDGPYAGAYEYATESCESDLPEGDGIGHDYREMPSPDLTESGSSDVSIEASLADDTVTVGDPVEVVVTVSNDGDGTGWTELILSAEGIDRTLGSRRVEVEAGQRREITLVTGPTPNGGKFSMTLNGDRIGTVTVEPEE